MKSYLFIFLGILVNLGLSLAQAPFSTPDNVGSGNCLDFNGSDDYVSINPMSNFPSNALTISLWVNTTDVTNAPTPISYAVASDDNAFVIQWNHGAAGNPLIVINSEAAHATAPVNDGEWHHIAVTWQSAGGNLTLYKDGVQAYSGIIQNGGTIPNNGSLILGQEQDAVGGGFQSIQAFPGSMDEFCIWNKVLTQQEVRDVMCSSLKGNEANLVGYWNMNEGSGNTITDLTSNGNNGTLQ